MAKRTEKPIADNSLFFGDNLKVLQEYVADESVDLIYLDPPFKSNADYNLLFAEQDGSDSAAQVVAFKDTWVWDEVAAAAYHEVVERGGAVSRVMQSFNTILGKHDMLAYLAMMAPRLIELQRVLRDTGSIYLHCDPTASHYLKLLMDAVFGPRSFRNEIVWRRTGAHSKARRYGPIHDNILFYTKNPTNYEWYYPKRPHMKGHIESHFKLKDNVWTTNFSGNVLTGSGVRNGESGRPWKGIDPTPKNRHWAVPGALVNDLLEDTGEDLRGLTQHEKLDRLFDLGFVKIVPGQVWPIYERQLREGDGQPLSDIWACQPHTDGTVFGSGKGIDEDVRWLATSDQERLGYQTQKPEGLLDRIIRASSRKGDVILDPFCGCGTAIAVAQRLERRWIGIDITHLAISLIRSRLQDTYGAAVAKTYEVKGEPVELPDAESLAAHDRYQFQYWALGLVGAHPLPADQKKGADRGIDGRIYFHDDGPNGGTKQVIFSVKSGKTDVSHLRDLRGVLDREKAEIGVLITLQDPTSAMRKEAASADFYVPPPGVGIPEGAKYPRLQILTVEELLAGDQVQMPLTLRLRHFKKAPKPKGSGWKTNTFDFG